MNKLEMRTIEDKCLWEIYTRLFKASTPEGDFEKMVEEGVKDENGKIHIPFMDYEIDETTMDSIIQDTCKEFKIKKKDYQKFKTTVYLGCSPKSVTTTLKKD